MGGSGGLGGLARFDGGGGGATTAFIPPFFGGRPFFLGIIVGSGLGGLFTENVEVDVDVDM